MKDIKLKVKNEWPPYKCKVCGMYEVEFSHDTCDVCGWEDDELQNSDSDYEGGANALSLNQYRKTWESNKEIIRHHKDGSKSHLVEELFIARGGVAKYVNAKTVQETKDWWQRVKNNK